MPLRVRSGHNLFHEILHGAQGLFVGNVTPGEDADEIVDARLLDGPPDLLFLPEAMARYVLVHELCHGRRLDHSEKFWDLLETFEPNARRTAAKLRNPAEFVPHWAQV